jgi:FlaA1/EpsC-like NDP-sugar epimerase
MKIKIFKGNLPLIFTMDIILVVLSWYGSHLLRFNFEIPRESTIILQRMIPFIITIKLIIFYLFNLYSGMWRYTSLTDLFNVIKASSTSSLIIIMLITITHRFEGFARSVFVIDWLLTITFISGYRICIRIYFWLTAKDETANIRGINLFNILKKNKKGTKNLIIIGAGDCGEKIYREIRDNARLKYRVVGFLDDDPSKTGMYIHGIPVLGTTVQMTDIISKVNAEEALIAIPSARSSQMRIIIDRCKETGIPFKTLPGIGELIDGKVTLKAIREVEYHDLLGREPIRLEDDRIRSYLENSKVMVTGAGGSIGSELCRQICRFRPSSLSLYERAETPLYEIELELKDSFPYIKIIPILGDIQDRRQLSFALNACRPNVIFHTAAYKHVPMLEIHPWKAVKNNIQGTINLIDLSKEYGVERFVFVSTDKAVRPSSIMGATKRIAEMLVQGENKISSSNPRFMIVRFGNVVGSAGSVIPIFKKQIEKGGPITVTHPEVTRYFMTIAEACQLVLQAASMGKGGEIFILDMGTPIRIEDMARDLIRLHGLEPDIDIQIKYIGLRPGEKIHEELIREGEGVIKTPHEKILVLKGHELDLDFLNRKIRDLVRIAYEQDAEGIKKIISEIVPDYSPVNSN